MDEFMKGLVAVVAFAAIIIGMALLARHGWNFF